MQLSGSAIKDVLVYFAGKLLAGVGAFGFIAVATRWLGVEEYGAYSLAAATAVSVSQGLGGWIRHSLLRYGVELSDKVRRGLSGAVAASALAACATAFALLHLMDGNGSRAVAAGLLAGVWVYFGTRSAEGQLRLNARLVSFASVVRTFVPLAGISLFFAIGIDGTAASALASLAIGLSLGVLVLPSIAPAHRSSAAESSPTPAAGRSVRELASFGLPIAAFTFVLTAQHWIARAWLENAVDPLSFGVVAAWLDVGVKVATLLLMPITMAAHSRIVHLWRDNDDLAERRIRWYASLALVAVGALLIGAGVIATPLGHVVLLGQMELIPAERLIVGIVLASEALLHIGLMLHKPLERSSRGLTIAVIAVASTALSALFAALLPPEGTVWPALVFLLLCRLTYAAATVAIIGMKAGSTKR